MKDLFENLKIALFDIIAYLLPGATLIALQLALFAQEGIESASKAPVLFVVASYLIGHILHALSYNLTDNLWSLYHKYKEVDTNGESVKEPKTKTGKIIKFYRWIIFGSKNSPSMSFEANVIIKKLYNYEVKPSKKEESEKDDSVKKQLAKQRKSEENQNLAKIKEVLIAYQPSLQEKFEYLHYFGILCNSLALAFLFQGFIFLYQAISSNITIRFVANEMLKSHFISGLCIVGSFVLFAVFTRRAGFFKHYRAEILNAFILTRKDD